MALSSGQETISAASHFAIAPMGNPSPDVTACLKRLESGEKSAIHELLPLIYDDLRALARGVFGGQGAHTLQPTALVHEAYMRLVQTDKKEWSGRRHFLRVAAIAMRQLLTDHARGRRRQKRGGPDRRRVVLEEAVAVTTGGNGIDLLALDEALQELERMNERQARIVELRFLAGLSVDETAEVLGVSRRTVYLDWDMARIFLRRALEADGE